MPRPRFEILNVLHESRVAAIRTARGGQRLLDAGLAKRMVAGGGTVQVTDVGLPSVPSASEVAESFAVAAGVARHVRRAIYDGRYVVVLSGSCHTALGSVAGLPYGRRGVVWLDCHGDFNTPETSFSGLLDGMTLASITGRCWKTLSSTVPGFAPVLEDAVVMAGVRDLDAGEEDLLESSAITRLSTEDVRRGASEVLRDLGQRVESCYVHVDLDVLDPSAGMANPFAITGGFSAGDLWAFLADVRRYCPVRVVCFASYDPVMDEAGTVCSAAIEAAGVLADGAEAH